MTARIGRGPQALLILGRLEARDQHWISGVDRSVLVLRGGRVVKTFGFPENMKQTTSLQDDPVDRFLHRLTQPTRHTRTIDLDLDNRFGTLIDSMFEPVGPRSVEILEIEFQTLLVRERNTARTLNWSFENLYWVDPEDGFVWKSQQHIARTFPPVHFEVLKPPG